MSQYFYIYNLEQAKFFIDSGLRVIDIRIGSRGHVYHKFVRDNEAEFVFKLWNTRTHDIYEGDMKNDR